MRWCDYLPAPDEADAIRGVAMGTDREIARSNSDDEPFSALAFKIMTDPFVGSLSFIRVYSGVLKSGEPSSTRSRASASGSAGCC